MSAIHAQGSAAYAPEKEALVWKIRNFPGGKEFLLRAKFGLPSVAAEEEQVGVCVFCESWPWRDEAIRPPKTLSVVSVVISGGSGTHRLGGCRPSGSATRSPTSPSQASRHVTPAPASRNARLLAHLALPVVHRMFHRAHCSAGQVVFTRRSIHHCDTISADALYLSIMCQVHIPCCAYRCGT